MRQYLQEIDGVVYAFGLKWCTLAGYDNERALLSEYQELGFSHYCKVEGNPDHYGLLGETTVPTPHVYPAALGISDQIENDRGGITACLVELREDYFWLVAIEHGEPLIDCDMIVDNRDKAERLFKEWLEDLSPTNVSVPMGWDIPQTFEFDLEKLVFDKAHCHKETATRAKQATRWLRKRKGLVGLLLAGVGALYGADWYLDKVQEEADQERIERVRLRREAREANKVPDVITFAQTHEYALYPSVYDFLRQCVDEGFNEFMEVPTWLSKDQWCDGNRFGQEFVGQGRFWVALLRDAFPTPKYTVTFAPEDIKNVTVTRDLENVGTRTYEREALTMLEFRIALSDAIRPFGGTPSVDPSQPITQALANTVRGGQLHNVGDFKIQIASPPELWARYLDEIPGVVLKRVTFTSQKEWSIEGKYYVQK